MDLVLQMSGVKPTGVTMVIRYSVARFPPDAAVRALKSFLAGMRKGDCDEGSAGMFTASVP